MDSEQKNPTPSENDKWLEEMLGVSETVRELGPDELAVHAAGLTHPADLELEKILAEDWDSVPDAEPAPAKTEDAFDDDVKQELPQKKTAKIPSEEASQKLQEDKTQYFKPVSQVSDEDQSPAGSDGPSSGLKSIERKTRPAPKKGYGLLGIPHILSTVIWLLVILAIGVTLGHTLWVSCADLMAFGKPDRQVTLTITERDTIDTISQKLADAGLIEYPTLFKYFATLTGKDEDIDVGTFTLNSKLDYNAMINNMINYGPAREEVTIMIPEGYTCAQIFALMEEKGVCPAAELEAYAANGELGEYWFLEGLKRGDKYCLEGYLFPDTYNFYTNDEPKNVIKKFLDGFNLRFTDKMKDKLATIQERTGLNLSLHQVVIIASMIEKETANEGESYQISSVIFNRLKNAANFPYLNIDATLIYALNGNIDPETGKTKPLTKQDLEMEHPYNTYNNRGLPPGAISNPGQNSLDAALDPDSSEGVYYYYVYNPKTASHLFAKTLKEHEKNIAYVNSLR